MNAPDTAGVIVSVVVPCFNEERRVNATMGRLVEVLTGAVGAEAWELVMIDDSSTDESLARMVDFAGADHRVRVVRVPAGAGKGKGAAVRQGLLESRGEFVLVTDADLAADPTQLRLLLDSMGRADVAVGTRVDPRARVRPARPLRRRVPAAVFRAFVRRATGLAVSDPQCGFKLYRRSVVAAPAAALETNGYSYEVELLMRLTRTGARIVDVPVAWSESSETNVRVLRDGLAMARDVVTIRRRLAASDRRPDASAIADASPHLVVSVVMPVYNERAVIAEVVEDVRKYVLDAVGAAELILVDDRGTDGSGAILAELADGDDRIRVIVNAENVGHGRSVRRGLDAGAGTWLLHLDSDGQIDVSDFDAMWDRRHGADLLFGVRVDRDDPLHRMMLTRAVNALASTLARTPVRDSNAGFKLIRRSLYRHLQPTIPEHTFAPSMLLVIGAYRAGARVVPVPIGHRARPSGPSSLHAARLARAVLRAARQTVRYGVRSIPPFRPDVGEGGTA